MDIHAHILSVIHRTLLVELVIGFATSNLTQRGRPFILRGETLAESPDASHQIAALRPERRTRRRYLFAVSSGVPSGRDGLARRFRRLRYSSTTG
jgi:hypothetical protein